MGYLLFLFIIPTIAIDYEGYQTFSPKIYIENSTEYNPFFPIRDNRINFRVKAGSNAKVVITTGPHFTQPMFEFMIGSYDNTYLYVRKNQNPNTDTYLYTYNILSNSEYRGFWIQLDYEYDIQTYDWSGYRTHKRYLKISFGQEDHVEALITKDEFSPHDYKFFGIGSWSNVAYWAIPADHHPLVPPRRNIIAVTENENYPSYKKMYHVTQRIIKFEVKAYPEVRIALAPNTKADNFFEIHFREDEKVFFTNYLTMTSKSYIAADFLSPSIFRRFWLRLATNQKGQFNTSTIELGLDDAERPFIIFNDADPLIVNYFSLSTIGSSGIWIVEETNEPPVFEGRMYVETINCKAVVHEKFYKVSSDLIRLQFRGYQASIVLTAEPYQLHPAYQFLINKERSVVFKSNGMNITFGILPKYFYEDEYKSFWIKYKIVKTDSKQVNTMTITLGYQNEVIPIIEAVLNENIFDVKYLSLATFGNSGSGYWIIEDSSIPEDDVVFVKRLITAPTPETQFYDNPVYSNVITFKVKAKEDASIYLLSDTNISNDIEIQIGHSNNKLNGIIQNNTYRYVTIQNLLDESEYRGFWIKFSNVTNNTSQLIRVGHDGFVDPFMASPFLEYYTIKGFRITTHNNRGNWVIKTKKKKPDYITMDDDIYTLGNGVVSYFRATSDFVKFKVHAKSDAVIVLSYGKKLLHDYFEIILSKDGTAKNIISKNGKEEFRKTKTLLHKNNFREFWLQWEYTSYEKMILNFGRAGESKPLFYWFGDFTFAIEYVGFTTLGGVNGTWSIPYFDKRKIFTDIVL